MYSVTKYMRVNARSRGCRPMVSSALILVEESNVPLYFLGTVVAVIIASAAFIAAYCIAVRLNRNRS
jgi:hypothetical protein